jgi:hypothetical protein
LLKEEIDFFRDSYNDLTNLMKALEEKMNKMESTQDSFDKKLDGIERISEE